MTTLNLRELANELDELKEKDASEMSEDEHERWEDLFGLEALIGDLHIAANQGMVLIPEDEFSDHIFNEYEESHSHFNYADWPFNHIDWDKAAEARKSEYDEVEFEGQTYLRRV